uniref:MBL associated serine protease 2 n=1 Tax=Bos taurus TaxID=9913 RepID=I2E4T8_BOVIN|nr:mannan-binding lectin serine peptidase 2 variant 1 [Bos taurus]AFJ92638.1 mannan-binding lectin serine peptidase 2 variant 4 [Bos taurus]
MRWVEAPRTCLAGVRAESRPHRPCPAPPSGCWSSWACCGAWWLRPRGHSGPNQCSGAWHRPASPTSTPTTRSGAGP